MEVRFAGSTEDARVAQEGSNRYDGRAGIGGEAKPENKRKTYFRHSNPGWKIMPSCEQEKEMILFAPGTVPVERHVIPALGKRWAGIRLREAPALPGGAGAPHRLAQRPAVSLRSYDRRARRETQPQVRWRSVRVRVWRVA
jgi:hypothetical protein